MILSLTEIRGVGFTYKSNRTVCVYVVFDFQSFQLHSEPVSVFNQTSFSKPGVQCGCAVPTGRSVGRRSVGVDAFAPHAVAEEGGESAWQLVQRLDGALLNMTGCCSAH